MNTGIATATRASAVALAGLLVGCASMPKVEAGYYLPKSGVNITLVQSAVCTDGDLPILKNDLAVAATYSSDTRKRYPVDLGKLSSRVGKTSAAFEFYDDGRLKSINTQQIGQGAEALKALLTVVGGMGGLNVGEDAEKDACRLLRELTQAQSVAVPDDDKKEEKAAVPLTIVWRGSLAFPDVPMEFLDVTSRVSEDDRKKFFATHAAAAEIDLRQDSVPNSTRQQLTPIFGIPKATFTLVDAPEVLHVASEISGATLALVEAASAVITVEVELKNGVKENFKGGARVPQFGRRYPLPIPGPKLFGETQFELGLSEAGKVTKLRYSSNSDPAGALGAVTSLLETQKDPAAVTTADQVKTTQAEADLIYQQQRLLICQATPAVCPK
jgi:hypothetical protein